MPFNAQALRDAGQQSDTAPPDGRYDVELVDSKIITANSDGRVWLLMSWRVIAGAQRDEQWDSWHTIDQYDKQGEPNQGLAITVQSLDAMGVDTEQIRDDVDLARATRERHGQGFDVEVKRRPPFVNTYVKGFLTGAGVNTTSPSSQASTYGQPPAQPAQQPSLAERGQPVRRDLERTGESDVTPKNAGDDFTHTSSEPPPQRGDIDPETGEPFPF